MTTGDSLNDCSRNDAVSLQQSCDVSFCDELPVPFVVIRQGLPVCRYLSHYFGGWGDELQIKGINARITSRQG